MRETESFEVTVAGCRSVTAPATYAQHGMWRATAWLGDDDAYFNVGWPVPLTADIDIDGVATALRRTLARFDTFRTTFDCHTGVLRQHVASGGALRVGVYDGAPADVDRIATEVLDTLVSVGFRSETEWPLRIAVITANGRPRLLLMVISHLVIDLYGWRVIERTLLRLLAEPAAELPDATNWHPVDQARYERSPAGQAVNSAALARWRRILGMAAPTVFDFEPAVPEPERFWLVRMESRALAAALAMVAGRVRVSDGAVLLAAVSVVLGRYTGHDETVFLVNVANRIKEESREIAGYLCWDSLWHLKWGELSFDALCGRGFAAALETYRHGVYDPAQARAIRADAELAHGTHIDLGCNINDRREHTGPTAALVRADPPDLAALAATTRISLVDRHCRVDTRFQVHAMDDAPGLITLELLADTSYVPASAIEPILRAVERLVVMAASGDLTPEEIRSAVDVPEVRRGPDWVRWRCGWTCLPAVRQVWSELVGGAGNVFAQPLDDGTHRLVGYYAGTTAPDELHAAFVAALGDRSGIAAPEEYVRCAAAPDDVDDEDAWCVVGVLARYRRVADPAALPR